MKGLPENRREVFGDELGQPVVGVGHEMVCRSIVPEEQSSHS